MSVSAERNTRKFKPPANFGLVLGRTLSDLGDGFWSVRVGYETVTAYMIRPSTNLIPGYSVIVKYNDSTGFWDMIR